jgi:hypothetical protein
MSVSRARHPKFSSSRSSSFFFPNPMQATNHSRIPSGLRGRLDQFDTVLPQEVRKTFVNPPRVSTAKKKAPNMTLPAAIILGAGLIAWSVQNAPHSKIERFSAEPVVTATSERVERAEPVIPVQRAELVNASPASDLPAPKAEKSLLQT